MPLESATFINDLVITNPEGSDDREEGADHLRLIKAVLQRTFLNADGAFDLAAFAVTSDLGTAAVEDIGTSGATVPLLNGTNVWSDTQTFEADVTFDAAIVVGNPTGGSKGAGSVNAEALYADGVAAVLETDFNASTILAADSDDTPAPLTVAASSIVGRKATGGIVALTAAETQTILNVEDGATADQTGTEIKSAYEGEADTNAYTDSEKTVVGNTSGTNTGDEVSATLTVEGIIERSTSAENVTGTSDVVYPTVAGTKEMIDTHAAGASLPVADSTSIVTFGTDKEMRIDVGAVADSTVRVLSMPDIDIDLTAKTGSFGGPVEFIAIAVSDETTALTVGTAKTTFRMPYGFTLIAVRISVTTAPTDATLTVDINESGSTILSTKLTIDATERTSTTAATPAVISDAVLADDAEITIDIDQIGSTIAGAGLKVYLIGTQT